MSATTLHQMDILMPPAAAVERLLARADDERELLRRQLALSREYEARRDQRAARANANDAATKAS